MPHAYVNRIATAVPPYDVHDTFVRFAESLLDDDDRRLGLFKRMVRKAGIERRYSCLAPATDPWERAIDADGFYTRGSFPGTAARMRIFDEHAPALAAQTVERLELGGDRHRITHLLMTCCTGFSAPGLDRELVERCGLPRSVERTLIGFMGCQAAINALRLARHIVRSEPAARVLILNLELCTLHLKETTDLEEILSFLLFADGCAAALVSAEPAGIALDRFHTALIPDTRDLVTWRIGDAGFDMILSGRVPAALQQHVPACMDRLLDGEPHESIGLWAVHPGGRTVLDAVERGLDLPASALAASRAVLSQYGNMSSATVMFVLEALRRKAPSGSRGCALAFGPGLVAEAMLFHT